MRRSLTMCGFLSVVAWGAQPVLATDRLEMPFTCATHAGEVRLTAGAPQVYTIIGKREQRAYTACREAGAPNCKTMMIHRFAISCNGKTVPWVEVAAKIRNETVGASWLEAGQLNLLVRTNHGDTQRTARFIMPGGFAPIGEVGASLGTQQSLPDTQHTQRSLPDQLRGPDTLAVLLEPEAAAADAADAAVAAAADMAARSAASSSILVADAALVSEESWQTVVYKHDAKAAVPPAASGLEYMYSLAALMLTAVLAMFGFFGGRWRPSFGFGRAWAATDGGRARNWWRAGTSTKLPRTDNQTFYNGVDSVAALLLQVESVVHSLKSAGPLRDTLSGELKGIRQRLASLKQADRGELSEARTSANLRAIVRDLERIRRIADSAAISMSKAVGRDTVPKTAAEAYELLGINSSVSEATLKKIVDGLRMSWHPDLARDAADRDLREERTKCINIAWDLITGKRAA